VTLSQNNFTELMLKTMKRSAAE